MTVVQILNALGIPALISSIVLLLVNRHYSKSDKRAEKLEKRDKQISDIEEKVEGIVDEHKKHEEDSGVLFNEYRTILLENKKCIDTLSLGLQALLRDRIIRMYNSYTKDKGFLPITARESLKNMYEQYHNLGGNGVITDLVNKLYTLPVEPPADYNGPYAE